MFRKAIYALLAVCIAASTFAGCTSSGSPSTASTAASSAPAASSTAPAASGEKAPETPASSVDVSKKVDVIMWMTGGSSPRDFERVSAELSKMTQNDPTLNCNLQFNIFNDSNTQQKMTLMLSSGEPIDLLYSAGYLSYPLFANKGAYLALDELVPTAAPALNSYVTKEMWDATRVNGNIYMVPCMWEEWVPYGFLWREDLRKKHNLPEPTTIETIEAYMQGIKEKEPDILVTAEMPSNFGVIGAHFTSWDILDMKYKWADWRVPYGLYIDYEDPTKVLEWWESDEFREDMLMFKRWADAGYWSKSALANTETKSDQFKAGKIACDLGFNSPNGYAGLVDTIATTHPDWEVGWLPYYRPKQLATPNHATQNGYSVPLTSQNPERALMVLEKLILDKDYYRLSQYGFEGEHYQETEDGFYEYIGDPDASGFPREGARLWALRNEEFMLYPKATGKILKELNDEFRGYTYPNIWTGFTEDSNPYQAERAAVMNVQAQYLPALQAGLVADVDAAITELIDKSKVAGLDKVREEYTNQWLAYVEEHNIGKTTVK
ncbi:DUF3502 domain-containing protein [Ruminococcaceae bacterium OttesenSCG-928-L11]|nr:DUF3502 domain-containing protein [Ruminococcaceae bacterium OttesenSCG-928-L11]